MKKIKSIISILIMLCILSQNLFAISAEGEGTEDKTSGNVTIEYTNMADLEAQGVTYESDVENAYLSIEKIGTGLKNNENYPLDYFCCSKKKKDADGNESAAGAIIVEAPQDTYFESFWLDLVKAGANTEKLKVYGSTDKVNFEYLGAGTRKTLIPDDNSTYGFMSPVIRDDFTGFTEDKGYKYIKIEFVTGSWYYGVGKMGYSWKIIRSGEEKITYQTEEDLTKQNITLRDMRLHSEKSHDKNDQTEYNGGMYIVPMYEKTEGCDLILEIPETRRVNEFWFDYVRKGHGEYVVSAAESLDGEFTEMKYAGIDGVKNDKTEFSYIPEGCTARWQKLWGWDKTTYKYVRTIEQDDLKIRYIKLSGNFNTSEYAIGKIGYNWVNEAYNEIGEAVAVEVKSELAGKNPLGDKQIVKAKGLTSNNIQKLLNIERDYVVANGTFWVYEGANYGPIIKPRYGTSDVNYLIIKAPDNVEFTKFNVDMGMGEHGNALTAWRLSASDTLDGTYTEVPRTRLEAISSPDEKSDLNASYMIGARRYYYDEIPSGTKFLKYEYLPEANVAQYLRTIGNFSFEGKSKTTGDEMSYKVKRYNLMGDGQGLYPTMNCDDVRPYFIVDAGDGDKFKNFTLRAFKNNALTTDFTISACVGSDYENGEYYVLPAKITNEPSENLDITASQTQTYTIDKLPPKTQYIKVTFPYYYNSGSTEVVADSISYEKIYRMAPVDDISLSECIAEKNYDFNPPKAEVITKTDGGARVESYDLNNKPTDYNYLTEYSNLKVVHDAAKVRNPGGVQKNFGGSWQIQDEGEAYFEVSAPDNSKINEFNLYVDKTDKYSDFKLYSKDGEIEYTSETSDDLYGRYTKHYNLSGNYDSIKVVYPEGIDIRYPEECRVIGYDFTWTGNPKNESQGSKVYTIEPGERQQEVKGWGVFPWFHGMGQHPLAEKALYEDMGATIIRFELYTDYTKQEDGTYAIDTEKLDELVSAIRLAQKYDKEYCICVWSPPASLKSNNSPIGTNADGSNATMTEEGEDLYAESLVKSMIYLKERVGLPKALSMQNEASSANTGFQSFRYANGEDYARVFNKVSRALDEAGLGEIIMMGPEGSGFSTANAYFGDNLEYLQENTEFAENLDALAFHAYGTLNMGIGQKVIKASGDRDKWMTEYCVSAPTAYERLLKTIRHLCSDTQWSRTNYWMWWMGYAPTNYYIDTQSQEVLLDGDGVETLRISNIYNALQFICQNAKKGDYVYSVNTDDTVAVNIPERSYEESDFTIFGNDNRKVFVMVNVSDRTKNYNVRGLCSDTAEVYAFADTNPDGEKTLKNCTDGATSIKMKPNSIVILVSEKEEDTTLSVKDNTVIKNVYNYTSEAELSEMGVTLEGAQIGTSNISYNGNHFIKGTEDGAEWSVIYEAGENEKITQFYVDIADAKINKDYFKVYALTEKDGELTELKNPRLEDLWAFFGRGNQGYRYFYDDIPKGTRFIKVVCSEYSEKDRRYIGKLGAEVTYTDSLTAEISLSADMQSKYQNTEKDIIVAAYSQSGALVGAVICGEGETSVTIPSKAEVSSVKLIVTDKNQKPLCMAKEVKLSQEEKQ